MRISDWSSDVCSSDLPYAARGACGQFDGAFFGQGLQMVFGGIGRFKTQGACDFGPCRWETGTSDFAAYEFKNLLLTLGKLDRLEERRVGKECCGTCRSRGSTLHSKKKSKHSEQVRR